MRPRPPLTLLILAVTVAAALSAAACQTQRSVLIHADGQSRLVTVERAETVGDALAEAGVTLGERDKVSPDVYSRLARSGSITVVRVTERLETVTETVAYGREIVRDEALPRGETHLLQSGATGERQRVFRLTLEDGALVDRRQTVEIVTRQPVSEVLRVGTMGSLPAVPVTGTLTYLSGGNAWVIRGNSSGKRPLTFSGDLDGRIFDLSEDAHNLAFTRRPAEGAGGLNTLWALNTLVVGESAQPQHQADVLGASWRGGGLVFSTGEATAGPPGWKASNDLWLLPEPGRLRQTLPQPGPAGAFGWWGRDLAVSPTGRMAAFGGADGVSVLDLETGESRDLVTFVPWLSHGDWVWTSAPSWSPDGLNVAAVVHAETPGGGGAQDSTVFDLWMLPVDGAAGRLLAANVGMWALPAWSPSGDYVAFGAAHEPAKSATSRYDLRALRLRDGQIFEPLRGTNWGGVEAQKAAWSPDSRQLAAVHLGDLYLLELAGGQPRALTDDGRSSLPQWR